MAYRKSLLALAVSSVLGSTVSVAAEQASAENADQKAKNDYEVIVVTQKGYKPYKTFLYR